ncbi:hypothetical protein HY469_04365 [Candidatus Roizmanbacteria bacterium]|nr:hypothetical protein [Candidatus Roizmanbacteria bacterium]
MSVQIMFSHTKEILALTIPILSVMVIVSLTTAGVINMRGESTLTPQSENTDQISSSQESNTPVPSEVASQVEKSSTSSASSSNNAESADPTATAAPTTHPETAESTESAATATATPTSSPTPTVTPGMTVTPTVSEGSFQFKVIQKAENEDVPVEDAKVVIKNSENGEILYEGISDTEGTTPEWQIPDVSEIDVYAYPPSALDTYCGTVLHTEIESLNTAQPIDLTLVHSEDTEFCIQED